MYLMNNGQPPLIDTSTGALHPMWVQWYARNTQSSLEDSIKAGVTQMLELQQRMIGFIRENTINPKGVLVSFGHNYNMMRPQGTGFSAFDSTFATESTGPYAELNASEPSLWYKLDEGKQPDALHSHPWIQWKIQQAGGIADLQKVGTEWLQLIKRFESITRSALSCPIHPLSQGPMMTTPMGYVSLMWVIWQGSKDTSSSYQDIHNKAIEYLDLDGSFS